jgi:lipoyl(octanoyl) transferase
MDLEPFSRITPCGYPGLEITQLSTLGVTDSLDTIAAALLAKLSAHLGYTNTETVSGLPDHANQESEHA